LGFDFQSSRATLRQAMPARSCFSSSRVPSARPLINLNCNKDARQLPFVIALGETGIVLADRGLSENPRMTLRRSAHRQCSGRVVADPEVAHWVSRFRSCSIWWSSSRFTPSGPQWNRSPRPTRSPTRRCCPDRTVCSTERCALAFSFQLTVRSSSFFVRCKTSSENRCDLASQSQRNCAAVRLCDFFVQAADFVEEFWLHSFTVHFLAAKPAASRFQFPVPRFQLRTSGGGGWGELGSS